MWDCVAYFWSWFGGFLMGLWKFEDLRLHKSSRKCWGSTFRSQENCKFVHFSLLTQLLASEKALRRRKLRFFSFWPFALNSNWISKQIWTISSTNFYWKSGKFQYEKILNQITYLLIISEVFPRVFFQYNRQFFANTNIIIRTCDLIHIKFSWNSTENRFFRFDCAGKVSMSGEKWRRIVRS